MLAGAAREKVAYVLRRGAQGAALVLFFVLLPSAAHAAVLKVIPAGGSFPVGKNFTVQIAIDAAGAPVNSAEGKLSFDSGKLSVVGVSKEGAFNLWVEEPAYSNTAGTVTFSGGSTKPFNTTRTIFSVTFRPKEEGSTVVSFSSSRVLAGAGQDVSGGTQGGVYTLTRAAEPQESRAAAPTRPSRGSGLKPRPPKEIVSSTHPDEDTWYATSTVAFTWDVPYGILAVRTGFGAATSSIEMKEHEPPITEVTYEGVEDGIWYFMLAYKNRNGWGEPKSYRVQIDTAPPEPFTLSAEGGDRAARLRFFATDTLSGVATYAIAVNGLEVETVDARNVAEGIPYLLQGLSPGTHEITVTAYDRAGNATAARGTVVVTGAPTEKETAAQQPLTPGIFYWVTIGYAILLVALIALLLFERKRHADERDRIRAEAVEAGERLVGVFDALREEIEEKVLALSHKPNMTDNERKILESLKEALDISEELLDKEIEDVRKLVK